MNLWRHRISPYLPTFLIVIIILIILDVIRYVNLPLLPQLVQLNQQNVKDKSFKKTTKKLLLYTYMRGGSSFLGDIFKENKDALYWFEALDGFYQDNFFTVSEIKPLNILYYSNGTKREITKEESKSVAEFHRNLFTCDYQKVPMSFFADVQHRRSSINLRTCGMTHDVVSRCHNIMKPFCAAIPGTYNNIENSIKQGCFQSLMKVKQGSINMNQAINEFLQCQDRARGVFNSSCERVVVPRCLSSRIIAAKEIRLTMELVEETMIAVPDLYLIYSVRDPRAIISSRYIPGQPRNKGLLTFEVDQESQVLCHRIYSDLSILKYLKQKFPGRVMDIKFEDLAVEPVNHAINVYKFIGEDIPLDVTKWIQTATNGDSDKAPAGKFTTTSRNSTAVINAWRQKLPSDLIEHINNVCKNVLTELNYDR